MRPLRLRHYEIYVILKCALLFRYGRAQTQRLPLIDKSNINYFYCLIRSVVLDLFVCLVAATTAAAATTVTVAPKQRHK